KSLLELVELAKPISFTSLNIFLKDEHRDLVGPENYKLIKQVLEEMIRKLNHLLPLKRFFILETVNLFQSPISLGKLIAPLFLLEGKDQQIAVANFIRPTFLSIRKNIDVLTSNENLFDSENIQVERGRLYSFVDDIAKLFLEFFDTQFVESFKIQDSPVTLAIEIIKKNPIFNTKTADQDPNHMISDPAALRLQLLEFIAFFQSHETLFNYASKRNTYNKQFLKKLTVPGKFDNIQPIEVSLILAGSLLQNPQLKPDEALIDAMGDEQEFEQPHVLDKRNRFFDQLSPSNINKVIREVENTFKKLGHEEVVEEFQEVESLSMGSLLKRTWKSFFSFGESLVNAATAPFKMLFALLMSFFKSSEVQEPAVQISEGDGSNAVEQDGTRQSFVEKANGSVLVSAQKYNMVSTSQVLFRGPFFGATKKDYSYNLLLFKQDEKRLEQALVTFQALFSSLQNSEHMRSYSHPEKKSLKEHYLALTFGPYLITLGDTFVMPKVGFDPAKSQLFPFILLFKKSNEKVEGRVLSRNVLSSGQNYDEMPVTSKNIRIFYETLFHLLHLLPEHHWKSDETQKLLHFLVLELEQAWSENPKFLFLNGPPKV
ncbi:MAG: hypothetical protein QNL04_15370, partial [SAR324 cluster bacterium]|nr:hypothetical protein [SAR324 cluster bacterium]